MDLTQEQIDSMLEVLSDEEREQVYSILDDFVKTGSSAKFNALIDKDFEEIPVDIETFITDPQYLGGSYVNEQGKCIIYPFWIEKFKELFKDGKTNFNEVILTGAIGLGKTTVAVVGTAYIIYKLMCLKNPQQYYEQKPNSKIYVAFFNITLELSYGVAYKDLQEALIKSPWFAARGTVSGRKNLVYTPSKGIEFMIGSKPEHALGKNVFCLSGDTEIKLSDNTYKAIKDIDSKVQVYNVANNAIECSQNSHRGINTKKSKSVIKITLADGTEFVCSPNHKFLLSNGKYKTAGRLKPGDDFMEIDKNVGIINTGENICQKKKK